MDVPTSWVFRVEETSPGSPGASPWRGCGPRGEEGPGCPGQLHLTLRPTNRAPEVTSSRGLQEAPCGWASWGPTVCQPKVGSVQRREGSTPHTHAPGVCSWLLTGFPSYLGTEGGLQTCLKQSWSLSCVQVAFIPAAGSRPSTQEAQRGGCRYSKPLSTHFSSNELVSKKGKKGIQILTPAC